MATFLVGPDDSGLFKSRTTWDFPEALKNASDGDVIELQSEFNYIIDESIEVDKNITIVGTLTGENHNLISNTISNIKIVSGNTVNIKNINLINNINNNNTVHLFVNNKSNVNLNYVLINVENTNAINAKGESNIVVKNSTLSSTTYPVVYADNSKIEITGSSVKSEKGSTVAINKKSILLLRDSTLSSNERNAIWSTNSKVNINKCVLKSSISNALMSKNSQIIATDFSDIDSIDLEQSKLKADNLGIKKHLFVDNESRIDADTIGILGINDNKINLFSNDKSIININRLLFAKLSSPNIKLERNVEFKTKQILYAQFNAQDSKFIFENNFLPKDKDDIQYFGEKPALEKLDEMIGIKSVKEEIKEFIAITQMNKKRAEQGITDSGSTLHSLFLGNPGTGKTTVARIVGKIFFEKGIISKDTFIETSRSDLVEGYIGQTALKTRKVLESALGGVLFIDEAYTLYQKDMSGNDFGKEAIDEILKFMEDHRSDIVIIFAGYTKEMMDFLDANPGLKSRIPNRFTFEDYSEDELIQMGLKQLEAKKYKVSKDKYAELVHNNFPKSNDNSNGRWIRNLNEKILRKTAVRLLDNETADLSEITNEDLENSMI